MDKNELYYLKLIEECAEVQQRAAKLLQFGENERQASAFAKGITSTIPPSDKTNKERLAEEITDLQAIIRLLGFPDVTKAQIKHKRDRVEHYAKYSVKLGRIKKQTKREKEIERLQKEAAKSCRCDGGNTMNCSACIAERELKKLYPENLWAERHLLFHHR